jgi:hypothetical protein
MWMSMLFMNIMNVYAYCICFGFPAVELVYPVSVNFFSNATLIYDG